MREHSEAPGARRSRWGGRWCVAACLVLFFSLTSVGGVRQSEAGFVAILAQTKVYVNILIDEWEKYSRILEDHLDKVTGVMQPFSQIHAGVKELTDLNGLRGVYRMADSYRASVSDPRCFVPGYSGNCALQRDFTPPEVYEVQMEARWGIADGRYTFERLEGEVFDAPGIDTAAEAAMQLLSMYQPGAAADLRITQQRIERNIQHNRWQVRRMRTLGNRGRYAARNFQRWGGPGRAVSTTTGCSALDVSDPLGPDGVSGTHDDPTILDQAMNADCLDAASHLDEPLTEQAHLSEMEAKTLRGASMIGLAEMSSLEVEQQVARDEAALASAERMAAQRRKETERRAQRLRCAATTGSFAYVDSRGACLPVSTPAQAESQWASASLF